MKAPKTDIWSTAPFLNPRRKKFTRKEIQDWILGMVVLDNTEGRKPLSKRQQAENAMHVKIAEYFDKPVYSKEF